MAGKFILVKESPHGIPLYAEVGRDSTVVWRVERGKATPMTRTQAGIRVSQIALRLWPRNVTIMLEEV